MVLFLLMLDYLLSYVFLLPLKDDRGRYRSSPLMTVGLVVFNVVVFVFIALVLPRWMGDETDVLLNQMTIVPTDVLSGKGWGALSMVTAAFLHASVGHLVGNMLLLFFFGRKVEDVLGPAKFGLFYLVCVFVSGIGSVLGRAALPLSGEIPGLGASGAVMGVMAAYLFLFHEQRIYAWISLVIIPIPLALRIPVWVFMLYTVSRDILGGLLERQFEAHGYFYTFVDSFGHLGGLLAGITCIYFFLPRELLYYRHRHEEMP